jgi:anti-sigma B factor antagonist
MRIIVRSMDFNSNSLSIELAPSFSLKSYATLADYVLYCKQIGFSQLDLYYPKVLSLPSFKMLQELEKQFNIKLRPATMLEDDPPSQPSTDFEFQHEMCPRNTLGGQCHIYHALFKNHEKILDYIAKFVLAVGNACLLDERILSHLRLCLYELGANTVEHAKFPGPDQFIDIEMVIGDKWIELGYKDNAEPFNTVDKGSFDIHEKIQSGSKRGLGLYLLKRLAQKISYARDAECNITSLKLLRNKDAYPNITRRITMKEFSVSIIPMESKDSAVLKITGSINSTSTRVLETHFDLLIKNGQYRVVVDLTKTEFISSSGIGMFIGTLSTLRRHGGDLVLMNVPELIAEILEILNLKKHFHTIGDLNELKTETKG